MPWHGSFLMRVPIAHSIAFMPMPPMIPMVLVSAGLLERECRPSPFPGCGLAREHMTGHSGAGELLELGRYELATAILRVDHLLDVSVQFGGRNRAVGMAVPPDPDEFGRGLAPSGPLLLGVW